jgi:hypothetical protein
MHGCWRAQPWAVQDRVANRGARRICESASHEARWRCDVLARITAASSEPMAKNTVSREVAPARQPAGVAAHAGQRHFSTLNSETETVAERHMPAKASEYAMFSKRGNPTCPRTCQAGVCSHRRLSPPGAAWPDGGTPLDRCGFWKCSKRRAARPVAVHSRLAGQGQHVGRPWLCTRSCCLNGAVSDARGLALRPNDRGAVSASCSVNQSSSVRARVSSTRAPMCLARSAASPTHAEASARRIAEICTARGNRLANAAYTKCSRHSSSNTANMPPSRRELRRARKCGFEALRL